MVIVASADVLLKVFAKWHTYDYLTRADAVVFAFLLLASPLRLMLDFRSGKQIAAERLVIFAYISLLMLAMMLGH